MSESAPADLMARLAAKFDNPQGASSPEQGMEPEPVAEPEVAEETAEVSDDFADLEWDGQVYQVPKGLKDAFMRNEDYTKKTQELAEQRKAIEHVQSLAEAQKREAAFVKSIEQEQHELFMIDSYLKQVRSMNWSDLSAQEMFTRRNEIDQIKERRSEIQESINNKRKTFTDELQAKLRELQGKSRELASKSISGFGEETEKTIREYAKSAGFTDRELDSVFLDPRSVRLIWEAAQYRKVEAGTAKAGQTAQQLEKALRPGVAARTMPKETANKLNFNKAMKSAKTSSQKADIIQERLAKSSIFRGSKQ